VPSDKEDSRSEINLVAVTRMKRVLADEKKDVEKRQRSRKYGRFGT
jgi:hypothetical protein